MRSRWLILALVVLAQLMVVLDATIVNIALPSAQAALGFSNGSRQWIVTGYALAFGSLLPLGGRLGDVFGRRRTLVLGSRVPRRSAAPPRASSGCSPRGFCREHSARCSPRRHSPC
jgi:MFS family permease